MTTRTSMAARAAAIALLAFFFTPDARACSICLAGDPLVSDQGTSGQQEGDLFAYFQVRGWRKTSGLLPGEAEEGPELPGVVSEEANRSQRTDLFLGWTPFDRFTFTLNVPYGFNRVVEREGAESSRASHAGIGDISLFGSAVLWRNRDMLPSRWLEARVMLKAPTGEKRRTVDGLRDPHLQVGTGSWDFGFGLAAVQRLSWGSVHTSAFYRVNTEGALDYEYGDVALASARVEVPLGHGLGWSGLDFLTPGLSLDFRYAGFDRVGGERFDDSGGSILYATPSLSVRLPWGRGAQQPSLRAAVQIPLGQQWLHHQQREREVWSAGLWLPF